MIVSASCRTDIPAFYARWFRHRLEAEHCRVASPYGGGAYLGSPVPGEVDGSVLWTRNLRPLLADLDRVRAVAPVGRPVQRPIRARESGNRPGCRCALSREIAACDTYPPDCVYCYAVADRNRAGVPWP